MKVDELKRVLDGTGADVLQVHTPCCEIRNDRLEIAGDDVRDPLRLVLVFEGFVSEEHIRHKLGGKRFVAMDCGNTPESVRYPQGKLGVRYAIPDAWRPSEKVVGKANSTIAERLMEEISGAPDERPVNPKCPFCGKGHQLGQ